MRWAWIGFLLAFGCAHQYHPPRETSVALTIQEQGTLTLADNGWHPTSEGGVYTNILVWPNLYQGFVELGDLPAGIAIATSVTIELELVSFSPADSLHIGGVVNQLAPLPSSTTTPSTVLKNYLVNPIARVPATGAGVVSITLDSTTDAGRLAIAAFNHSWQLTYRNENDEFVRTLVLVFGLGQAGGAGYIAAIAPDTLSVTVNTETPTDTGIVGSEFIRDRARGLTSGLTICHKSGRWVATDEAVMDGYTRQLVHPSEYDPPDQLPTRKRPRPEPTR